MKRCNSLSNSFASAFKLTEVSGLQVGKSLPNIQISLIQDGEEKRPIAGGGGVGGGGGGGGGEDHDLKRQSSKKIKILQKTWDKVMTIIHPSGRRNSGNKKSSPSDTAESPRCTYSPLGKVLKSTSSPPSTPSKRLVFDFEPIETQVKVDDLRGVGSSGGGGTERNRGYYHCPESTGDPEAEQVARNYVELQKRLSDELHGIKDEKRKEESLSEDFKKRLQQWEMWKASTGKFHYTEEELQKIIPHEFSKKLQEWEYLKSRPRATVEQQCSAAESSASSTTPIKTEQRRKKKKTDESHRQKELAWLEKQLEKIETEKKRLEREMVKYCEREERLQKMREALRNNPHPKQEVWIKTPTAECKVEGINEKFTKKLYKWEEKRGIQPECSTMALLNPKYFASSPEPEQQPSSEVELIPPLLVPPEETDVQERISKDYSSQSEVSEVEYDEYEEATDSFATKDEPASGASNTDSDCFNLKPGFRRRSSDAISTPISSARSPSQSCCTSDDEENCMLQTVAENEEEKLIEEKPAVPIVKAKPIVVEEEEDASPTGDNTGVIVKTQRTIFKPVEPVDEPSYLPGFVTLNSPTLVKSFCTQVSRSRSEVTPKLECEPPRIIGAIRKTSTSSSVFRLPPIPIPKIKDGSKPILGKIPVWCSPLMARRRFLDSQLAPSSSSPDEDTEKFKPQQEFSLDKFLESNSIPIPPPRPSRIPVTASPGCSRKKYSFTGSSRDEDLGSVSLLSLTRSNSFQNPSTTSRVTTKSGDLLQLPVKTKVEHVVGDRLNVQSSPEIDLLPQVAKSKSTGSILGSNSPRGLFGIASSFVHKTGNGKQRKKK